MCLIVQVGNFLASQDETGNWIYKAIDGQPLAGKKAVYREEPQFAIQTQIEGTAKAKFKLILNKTVLEIVSLIK